MQELRGMESIYYWYSHYINKLLPRIPPTDPNADKYVPPMHVSVFVVRDLNSCHCAASCCVCCFLLFFLTPLLVYSALVFFCFLDFIDSFFWWWSMSFAEWEQFWQKQKPLLSNSGRTTQRKPSCKSRGKRWTATTNKKGRFDAPVLFSGIKKQLLICVEERPVRMPHNNRKEGRSLARATKKSAVLFKWRVRMADEYAPRRGRGYSGRGDYHRGRGGRGGRGFERGRGDERGGRGRGGRGRAQPYQYAGQSQGQEFRATRGKEEEFDASALAIAMQQSHLGGGRSLHKYVDDESVSNLAKRPALPSSTSTSQPYQRAGKPISIATNHFPFQVKQQTIFQYSVEFRVSKSDAEIIIISSSNDDTFARERVALPHSYDTRHHWFLLASKPDATWQPSMRTHTIRFPLCVWCVLWQPEIDSRRARQKLLENNRQKVGMCVMCGCVVCGVWVYTTQYMTHCRFQTSLLSLVFVCRSSVVPPCLPNLSIFSFVSCHYFFFVGKRRPLLTSSFGRRYFHIWWIYAFLPTWLWEHSGAPSLPRYRSSSSWQQQQ